MILSVIPSLHSLWTKPIGYFIDEDEEKNIAVGSMVEVPMKNGKEYAIVAGKNERYDEDINYKGILRIISPNPILAPYQVSVIQEIAQKYMIPIHRVLGFFLPKSTVNRLEKKGYDTLHMGGWDTLYSRKKNILTVSLSSLVTPEIIWIFLEPSTVIICPDDFMIESLREKFTNSDTLFLPSDSTDTRKAQAWIDIFDGKYPIIFWNRRLLYYNLSRYRNILYIEDAFANEYFHYPTQIHFTQVLRTIADTNTFHINIVSSLPKLTTRVLFREFALNHIDKNPIS